MHNNAFQTDCKLSLKKKKKSSRTFKRHCFLRSLAQKPAVTWLCYLVLHLKMKENELVKNTPRWYEAKSGSKEFSKNMLPNSLRSWAPSIQHPAKLSPLTCAGIHLNSIWVYAYMSKSLEAEAKDILFINFLLSFPSLLQLLFPARGGEENIGIEVFFFLG